MKHLHLQFILASIGMGFGIVLLAAAIWNVRTIPLNTDVPWRTTLVAWLMSGGGLVLVAFGYHGVRMEMYGQKK